MLSLGSGTSDDAFHHARDFREAEERAFGDQVIRNLGTEFGFEVEEQVDRSKRIETELGEIVFRAQLGLGLEKAEMRENDGANSIGHGYVCNGSGHDLSDRVSFVFQF